ncbi:MAG TPA: phage major capsid protein [Humibacter sp.]|nr:phage major capsid protein [Humibacter sp.]
MKRLNEVLTRMGAIRTELLSLAEIEEPTDEQSARFVELETEFDTLEAERAPLAARAEKIEAVRSAALDPANVHPVGPEVIVRTQRDPFDSLGAVRTRSMEFDDMQGRAFDAVEAWAKGSARHQLSHDAAEKVTRLIEADENKGDDGGISRHLLIAGSDEYHRAFKSIIKNQGEINALDPEDQSAVRAALSLTGANGGYLIPVTLDPTIILTNSGSANPYRRISRIKTITTNFWEGVTSAGVNAAWIGEGGVVGDNTPTFGEPVITPDKASAWVFGSYEVLSDSDFAQQFPALLTDAKDRLEENAFAVGAGTGGVPKGITIAATTTVTTAAVATYAIADIYALQAAIPPRWRRNGKSLNVVMNVGIIDKTRQFDTAGGASYWTNLGQGQPETVIGMPIEESSSMVATTTTGSKIAVAGDFDQFAIVDRVGMTVMYEPMVKDSATARPTGQAGWFAYWRVGSDALVPAAFRTLVVQ